MKKKLNILRKKYIKIFFSLLHVNYKYKMRELYKFSPTCINKQKKKLMETLKINEKCFKNEFTQINEK